MSRAERLGEGAIHILARIGFLLFAAATALGQAGAGDAGGATWPSARGGPSQSASIEASLPGRAAVLWRYSGGEEFAASPVSDGKILVAGDLGGVLHCLDAATGRLLWKKKLAAGIEAPALIAGARIYAATVRGELLALAAADGATVWTWKVPAKTGDSGGTEVKISGGATLLPSGAVVFGCYDARVYCVSAAGRTLWSFATGGYINGSLATDGKRVFVGGCDGKLRALDAATGKEAWSFKSASYIAGSVAVAPGDAGSARVLALDYEGELLALDAATGRVLFVADLRDVPATTASSPAARGRTLVATMKDGTTLAFEGSRGARLWRSPLGAPVAGSALIAGEEAWVLGRNGWLRSFALASGKTAREVDLGAKATAAPIASGAPIAAGGAAIFAALADGGIVRVGGK